MIDEDNESLRLTYGEFGIRFAGPDLLDYAMIFEIIGGDFLGDRLRVDSAFHPCCGTLEINASLFGVYKRWHNKLDGCKQHQRVDDGERRLRGLIRNVLIISNEYRRGSQ